MHGTWNGVELKVLPNHQGGVSFKTVFSKDDDPKRAKCVKKAKEDAKKWFENQKNAQSALNKMDGAKEWYDMRQAGREWAELKRNLERLAQ